MKNLNLICPNNQLSYGVVSNNLLFELAKQYDVALFPIDPNIWAEPHIHSSIQKALKNAELPNFDAPSLRIFHPNSLAQHVGRGPKIGFPIFELDHFNEVEQHHLNNQDYLFTCSKWAQYILIENKIWPKPFVVPLGINPSIFNGASYSIRPGLTRFFSLGKLEAGRKGYHLLHDIFNQAFGPKDKVELHISWTNHFLSKEETDDWEKMYKDTKLGDKIFFVPWHTSQYELSQFIKKMHCGIFLYAAEGWNLPLLESMACGLNVIATNFSGPTEYLSKENAHLINIDNLEVAFDPKWWPHNKLGKWAQIGDNQIDETIEYMRTIHALNSRGELLKNEAGIKTGQKYTWANSAQTIYNILENL